ncbi:TetR/AcrR family transcriptional regulator [Microbacterium lushaniae]|uniref:TetR/AcrR family transcriptional regulator n=1 Tax=Microbacterium lushaniae TaxID=2614639 RepID=A0A5J6KZK7_9MICO|nr:TetR/AcrR family transcriptional regulator [Microbacterium lushaniae]QEW01650.1 TetR/AcrR family transcriptional regulator [Microbacterium lushaniae]
MPRASAADAARTAHRILDAALERFTAEGYAAASVDDIARAAGVTRGAVYHHYTDKRGLLRAAARAGHERVASAVVRRAEGESDPAEQLRAGCHAFVDSITTDAAARLLLIEAPAVLGWSEWRGLDAAASVAELRDAVAQVAPASEVEALTQLLSGAMNEGALWVMERDRHPQARAALHRSLDRLIDAATHPRGDVR